jgi:hypothetical protein
MRENDVASGPAYQMNYKDAQENGTPIIQCLHAM